MNNKEREIEIYIKAIKRKVHDFCFEENKSKQWYKFQGELLNKLFDQLNIVKSHKEKIIFYKYLNSKELDYFIS